MENEMKKLFVLISILSAVVSLSACGKRELTQEEMKNEIQYKEAKSQLELIRSKVPKSEVVGKVNDRDIYIHRFYDAQENKTCYFTDYHYVISCN
jgi:uncharacterized lipoprotein YehR (DUF1307 family)